MSRPPLYTERAHHCSIDIGAKINRFLTRYLPVSVLLLSRYLFYQSRLRGQRQNTIVNPSFEIEGCAATRESGKIPIFFGMLHLSPILFEYIIIQPFFSRFPASQRVNTALYNQMKKKVFRPRIHCLLLQLGTGVLHFDFCQSCFQRYQ